jgi:DNA-directed RNA polymerase specialized sigma24 family protein
MGSFATDQSLLSADLGLLGAAATGDKRSLREVIERFKTPLLAVALRSVGDLDSAFDLAEAAIGRMCKDLLAGRLPPTEWAAAAGMYTTRRDTPPTQRDGPSLLEGLHSVPRVARKRLVREALPKLTLPELTAVLLQHVDQLPPARMVGLVAGSEADVCERLVSAQRKLLAALQPGERPGEPEQAVTS